MGIARIIRHPMFIVFAVFMVAPVFVARFGAMSLTIEVMIWAIFAVGFNILLGYTGLPSFGHGLFFGTGAYICGLIQHHLVHSTWISIFGSMVFCGAVAAVMGLFLARKRGIYFALLTIAFTQMFFFIAFQWDSVTGGENGLMGIERYPLSVLGLFNLSIDGIFAYYYFVFAVLVAGIVLLWKMVHSPLGSVLYAIKQNELRAKYLGYNTLLYKWASLVISALFAGLAGALYAMLQHGAFANPIHWTRSGDVVMMALVGGGLTNFFGPILGAGIFIALRDIISTLTEHWYLFYGLLIVFIVLFLPEGILGALRAGHTSRASVVLEDEMAKSFSGGAEDGHP
jgi:branched-chain amino acid transport system permease protein